MINGKLSSIFNDMADMEEIEGNRWESLAYRKVAMSISMLSDDVAEIYRKKELRKIDGVGTAIEKKIIEYIETGGIRKYNELREKYNIDFESLRDIQGLGPKRIAALYHALKIRNLDDLIEAIKLGKVAEVPGFGTRSQEGLNKSVEMYLSIGHGRRPLALAYNDIMELKEKMEESGLFTRIEVAGSTRRWKDTIGDVDILVSSRKPEEASEFFVSMEEVKHVIVRGDTKISVLLQLGLNCDLRIIDEESYGAALQYFTGSKEHNIRLRDLAIGLGMKLNEYGLYHGEMQIAGKTEEGVYGALGLDWVPPELRENMGEVEAAASHGLPEIIEFSQVHGDLHAHTDASDGTSTFKEMTEEAEKLGYSFIALTEHSRSLKVANGLDEARFRKRNAEIDRYNDTHEGLHVLKGVELEILKDGALDLSSGFLDEMDIVNGAMHQWISDDISINTARIVRAVETGRLTSLAHPTGRLIGSRDPYRIDFEKVFQACHDHDVALEINGYPTRSDLPFDLVNRAREFKVRYTLGSDAHSTSQLRFLRFANAIARRGWLKKEDVLNTGLLERILK